MLDHILATAQIFEREHGIAPNVIYLNTAHFQALLTLYPELFDNCTAAGNNILPSLGAHLVVVMDGSLMHPRAAYLPGAALETQSPSNPASVHADYAIRQAICNYRSICLTAEFCLRYTGR